MTQRRTGVDPWVATGPAPARKLSNGVVIDGRYWLPASAEPIDKQLSFSDVGLDGVPRVPAMVEVSEERLQKRGIRIGLKSPDYAGAEIRIKHDRLSWGIRKRGAVRIMRSSSDVQA
jgi:hypothetical protein